MKLSKNTLLFLNKVSSFIPEERIATEKIIISGYVADLSSTKEGIKFPPAVILPKNVEEIQKIIILANKYKIPIAPISRGSNIAGLGLPSKGEVILDLRLMDKILEINEDSAYALIEPGVTFHQLSLELKKKNFIIHNPTASGGSSVLANYLMKPSGNLSAKWDPDPLISLEVVLPNGDILRTGSASFENGGWRARYGPFPDLTGLFACSYGTLGIVTKGSVKIFDKGEYSKVLAIKFNSLASAIEFMKIIIRRNIADSVTFWSWVWNVFHSLMNSKDATLPIDVEKVNPKKPPEGIPFGIATIRLSGFKEVVSAQQEICIKLAKKYDGDYISPEEINSIHPGCWDYINSYFGDGILPKLGEECTLRTALWLPGWLIKAEPKAIIKLEKLMWEFAEKEAKPPYMFRVIPFNNATEFFMAFVILITGDIKKNIDYILHLKKAYANFYHKFLKEYGAIMFRYRKDPSYFALTGNYAKLLKKIKKLIDPNNIMHPGVNLFLEE